MFEKRNHLTDPSILVICPFCSRDLYPFKNIDRFKLILKTIDDLERSFIKVKCFNCKNIFFERKSRHKVWLNHYRQEIINDFDKQKSKMDRKLLKAIESGSEKK